MSVDKAPSGRWRARWRDSLGHAHSKTFDRKIDATRHEQAMRVDVDRGTYVPTSAGRLTVRVWSEMWLTGARKLGPGGRETYQRDLDRHILPALGDIQLVKLTDDLIDQYLTARLDTGAAASSVHREYRTVNTMLNRAIARHKLTVNPCGPIDPPKVPRTEMRFLTVEEVESLAAEMSAATRRGGRSEGRYRAWVYVAAWGGLRWSECVGLERRRVEEEKVHVVDQLVRGADGEWDRRPPKTGAGLRVVSLPDFAADELGEHLDRFSLPGPTGLVFPNQHGDPMNGPSFRANVWLRACGRAGLAVAEPSPSGRGVVYRDAPRPHDLRHTYAALSIKAKVMPRDLQQQMGHSSIGTTMKHYGHLYGDSSGQVAAQLSELRAAALAS